MSAEVFEAVKEHFGLTKDWREVGWILPDGSLIDFSGKRQGGEPGVRYMDHSEIGAVVDSKGSAVLEFMAMGAIRVYVQTAGAAIVVEPTPEQYHALRRYWNYYINDGASVDLVKIKGYDEHMQMYRTEQENITFPPKTNPETAIQAIQMYFSPPTSVRHMLGRGGEDDPWHEGFSVYGSNPPSSEAFQQWFGNSKVVDENGDPLVVYHGTPDAEPAVIPVFLSIQNPLIIDAQGQVWRNTAERIAPARLHGHDGVIIHNTVDTYHTIGRKKRIRSTVFVVFSPEQIKSVENDGSWDTDDPDYRSNPPI